MIKFRLASLLSLLTLQACTSMAESDEPKQRFEDYRQQTLELIRNQRNFQTADHQAELDWNAPRQWTPSGTPKGGVLLVHGLGDSAWSFHDVAQMLAAQGYMVRTVLLPGHGTKPEDMLDVRLEQWQRVVREQAQLLACEVPKVYLGGFSTGANLVLDYAYGHDEIAGLLLFSPAFRSNSGYAWLTPWIGWARPWLAAPNQGLRPMQTPVRYMNMPTNGFAQFYRSSALAQDRLHQRRYDKPVFIAIAEHDSVLDTDYVLDNFSQRFSNPASRLIWYGDLPARAANTPRVEVRKDYLPEYRISRFSHMGLLFSADNPLYGVSGSQRICWNGQSTPDTAKCMAGEPVWYSDWGYTESGKIHARLTFNPYFEWQTQVMLGVLNATP
ncbi:alpha/beta hydrolase [Pseudomonas syringae]|uniref:Lysophospholipase, alpha-beta hydrolase superfamily n=2 Tax=Pseudomonas TaxID=286 RepID=A0AB37ZI28_PSESX|nr:alpha/beta fold hydrolase [Pseudomonas syringae]SDG67137.1 Lysophospholipase, alpha-beta hydrolase superfamily [Pseudomonas sp. BS3767]SDM92114.1 Lysophospholipase, alpha-beta hydrolase superfamily [Pseudomonas sp. BS3759]NAP20292.1 alpha/beta fold hydrolase [Pseudomonas syringae]NAP23622.1 alpha/beta fold hydrolase [Pseudomonas syringae]